ncbi:MAG TPA: DUF4091 domain-containing protein [bacterium]|nr:DUF4091 domain-containing protein [bacterium]
MRSGAEPARIWCVGDWARIDPLTGRVLESDIPPDTLRQSNEIWDGGHALVVLKGVRNEFLSFQIVIEALESGLRDLFVSAQDLEGPARLDAARHVQFFREIYLPLDGGMVPDALWPMDTGGSRPASITDPDRGPSEPHLVVVWVDVYIPKAIPPGVYESVFRISHRGGYRLSEFTVRLEVLEPTLPDSVSLDTILMSDGPVRTQPFTEREFHRAAHAHRSTFAIHPLLPDGSLLQGAAPVLRGVGDRISVASWTQWDERFGPLLDGSAFHDLPRGSLPVSRFFLPFGLDYPSSFRHWGTDQYELENRTILTEFIYHIAQKGWIEPTFIIRYQSAKRYGFYPLDLEDPVDEADIEALLSLAAIMRTPMQSHPGVHAILWLDYAVRENSGATLEKLRDSFDVFAIHAEKGLDDPERIGAKKDFEFWLRCPTGGVADTFQNVHDYPWIAWQRNIRGLCFQNTVDWTNGVSPGSVVSERESSPLFYYSRSESGLDGPVVSMRLKALRRGLQDYELLELASQRKGVEAVRDFVRSVVPCPPLKWHEQRSGLLALVVK